MMFAHQVIEDIKRSTQPYVTLEFKEKIIALIKNSQQFHLSNIGGLFEAFKSIMGKKIPIFYDQLADVRLPYKISWFDYLWHTPSDLIETDAPKRAILAIEIKPDLMHAILFNYMKIFKSWFVEPVSYIISIGSSIGSQVDKMADAGKKRFLKSADIYDYNVHAISFGKCNFEITMEEAQGDLTTLNNALMLLSCKNIGTEKVTPSEALQKQRKKSGKQELFSYHTLVIKPTTHQENSIPQHLWQNRIHLCRGHFKTYTVERPLLGKFTGRYWWQAQARGNKKLGIVAKDYEVKFNQVQR